MGFSLFKKKNKSNEEDLGNQVPELNTSNNHFEGNNLNKNNLESNNSSGSQQSNFEDNSSDKTKLPNLPNFNNKNQINEINSENKKDSNDNHQDLGNKEDLVFPQKSEFELSKNKLNYTFEEESHKNLIETKLLESALKQRSPYNINAPLFITINKYREVLKEITNSREFLDACEDLKFKEIEFLEKQEKYYETLRNNIEDLQRRFLYIDKKLFEENNV